MLMWIGEMSLIVKGLIVFETIRSCGKLCLRSKLAKDMCLLMRCDMQKFKQILHSDVINIPCSFKIYWLNSKFLVRNQ